MRLRICDRKGLENDEDEDGWMRKRPQVRCDLGASGLVTFCTGGDAKANVHLPVLVHQEHGARPI